MPGLRLEEEAGKVYWGGTVGQFRPTPGASRARRKGHNESGYIRWEERRPQAANARTIAKNSGRTLGGGVRDSRGGEGKSREGRDGRVGDSTLARQEK